MKKILFLCTGNSCRSQMAHGWAKNLLKGEYEFYSAGLVAHGLNPYAVLVMQEAGVDISHHKSETIEQMPKDLDIVITVCSHADETCPHIPGAKVIHHGFDDPPRLAQDIEDEQEKLEIYRRVRDEIREFVKTLKQVID